MVDILDKSKCCGCTACYSVCPQNCISMEFDDEGFAYPKIDLKHCVTCGGCEKVCPLLNLNSKESNSYSSEMIAIQNLNEEARMSSTAGGAFSLIADYLISLGAIVYAVGYDESVMVCHKRIDKHNDIASLRGSKYVQSWLGNTIKSVRTDLKNGKLVLFVGTPCQVYALKNCIGNNDHLFTIDLLCLGVSSPKLFEKYVLYIEGKYREKITNIEFRNKNFGYATPNVRVNFENGKYIEQKYDSRVHANLFFKHYYNVRPSCYECEFREMPRKSDFTIGDFTEIGHYSREMDDDKGTTKLWVHTDKGRDLLKQLRPKYKYVLLNKNISSVIGGPKKQINKPERRQEFFQDAFALEYELLIDKWEPPSFRSELIGVLRPIINRLPFKTLIFKELREIKRKKYNKNVRNINN